MKRVDHWRTVHLRGVRISRVLCLLGLLLLAGCAASPTKEARGPVFYPPLPNPPRLQHLVSLSTVGDFGDKSGAFAAFVLGKETKEKLVNKPYGVALFHGKMYVVDVRGPGYFVFDLAKKTRKFVPGSGGGAMKKPINITIDRDGTKYITDTGRDQILVFDKDDQFVRALGTKGEFKPSDVAIKGNRLYVADLEHKLIQVLDKRSGKLLFTMATAESKKTAVLFPTNLAWGPDGDLYISDTGNFRIQKFTPDGHFVRSYGGVGTALGKFARPKGIAVDRAGRIYVVDAAFENVQVFNNAGKLLMFFGEPGYKPQDINLPADITIDYDNVRYFQKYAAPGFKLKYVILITSNFGVNPINVFGFGKMAGMDYSAGP